MPNYANMTPQQRSALRKRLMKAGKPIPPELAPLVRRNSAPKSYDNRQFCTVVYNGIERTFELEP